MKVAFVLLAHEEPDLLRPLITSLLAAGANVFAHHDVNGTGDLEKSFEKWGIADLGGNLFIAPKVQVRWGEWSIIEATLNCLDLARKQNDDSDFYMLISGSCMPVKPIALLAKHLEANPYDHIEAVNALEHRWVKDGIQEPRWEKYHFFNWRYNQSLFDLSLKLQSKIGIKRKLPLNHIAHMGSQWWCLRRGTIHKILSLIDDNSNLCRFFKKTWVPDELFFQTLVANLIAKNEIVSRPLTRYTFNSWGIPRVYYDDDYPELLAENKFFVRKLSHRAFELRKKLTSIASMHIRQFSELLNESVMEHTDYVERIKLQNHCNDKSWHSLVTRHENCYDYVKSIPNRIVVVCCNDTSLKNQALNQLDRLDKTVVYGDLFDSSEVCKGYSCHENLPIDMSNPKLIRHEWQLVLGEISLTEQGKVIVFSIGEDSLEYLDILRWKKNLNIILLDHSNIDKINKSILSDLYLQSIILNMTIKRHCDLTRLSITELTNIIDSNIGKKNQLRHIRMSLAMHRENEKKQSLLKHGHDHYDFIKSIECKIVVLTCTDTVLNSIKNKIENYYNTQIIENFFNALSTDSNTFDWHYLLADVAHICSQLSPCNILFIHVGIKHLHFLETLRWKKDLLVLDITINPEILDNESHNFYFNLNGLDYNVHNYQPELDSILSDRNCHYEKSNNENIDLIQDHISNFIERN
ncbi:beta-1,6-N-acetylglucosaminyltransferase [Desulfosediminicola flagellatus]|uniref:beta-1,6-N-acetylglucosaminyltransferase n=1 Tax=Desulfosediminicola flagellatus TaxID=2569541 RepID=UPI00142F158F|nr:beta-1,6-N-acetylglucosaminyltransferase [Desulfosediminicola flagellatus]